MAISIGCGSWADDAYVGVLYPKGLPKDQRLKHYATHFEHVEVNSSYYATPKIATVQNWVKQTPPSFTFDLKLHRAISQSPGKFGILPKAVEGKSKKTKGKVDGEQKKDLVAYTLEQLQPLFRAKKFGTFLLMLAPSFTPDRHVLNELDGVIAALQPHSIAVELRERHWVEGKTKAKTLDYFREKQIAWVTVDMPDLDQPGVMPPVDEVTSPKLAYLRLHGRNAKGWKNAQTAVERHTYLYRPSELKEIVRRIRKLERRAERVRVVANNHAKDFAPRTALELKRLLGQAIDES
jgi:uncharacterized protein YecE (DUF72 family)